MHDETTAAHELRRVGIDVERESKQDLSLGALVKEAEKGGRIEQVSCVINKGDVTLISTQNCIAVDGNAYF